MCKLNPREEPHSLEGRQQNMLCNTQMGYRVHAVGSSAEEVRRSDLFPRESATNTPIAARVKKRMTFQGY